MKEWEFLTIGRPNRTTGMRIALLSTRLFQYSLGFGQYLFGLGQR
jgi:hypothetical protein